MRSPTLALRSRLYAIGGSPCSGKSSVAETLATRHNLAYFNCDDAYERHRTIVTAEHCPVLFRVSRASPEEVWLQRAVCQQIEDEFELYREEFPLIVGDLDAMSSNIPIIAEGAALLPRLLAGAEIPSNRAIWMVPTEQFQREHYARREWRHDVVSECSDPAQAWENWMARDAGFANAVAAEAQAIGFNVIVVDGSRSIDETVEIVEAHFGLIP